MIRVYPDLINDEGYEIVKSNSTPEKRRQMKKSSRNSRPIVRVRPIKETRKEIEPAPRKKVPTESSKLMRRPITLADFLLPLSEEEDELQISNCIRIYRSGHYSPSHSEDSNGEWVPPTMPPPMDDDDHENDPESDLDEEEYLSDRVLNENDFITDPYFYQEIISEIEVWIYNPRLPEPGDWSVDPPSFPLLPKVHPDPLPIIDENETIAKHP